MLRARARGHARRARARDASGRARRPLPGAAGAVGAGKSSVLLMIAGLVRPRRGQVECGDRLWLDTEAGVELAPERRRCGYVFQDYALFGHMSAWRNVAYAQRRLPRARRRRAAVELLDRFGVGRLADARPTTLSGGERQRVALARTLASNPSALLLDEPLSALDVSTRAKATRALLELLGDSSVPTVLVTHDFDDAAAIADEVAVIEDGRIVQRGSAEELSARPVSAFVADLTGAVVLQGVAGARRPDGDRPRGRRHGAEHRRRPGAGGDRRPPVGDHARTGRRDRR